MQSESNFGHFQPYFSDFDRFRSISVQGLASWCLCRTWHSFGSVDMELPTAFKCFNRLKTARPHADLHGKSLKMVKNRSTWPRSSLLLRSLGGRGALGEREAAALPAGAGHRHAAHGGGAAEAVRARGGPLSPRVPKGGPADLAGAQLPEQWKERG